MPPIEITSFVDEDELIENIVESLGSEDNIVTFVMGIDKVCESYDFSLSLVRSLLKNMLKDFDSEQHMHIKRLMENSTVNNPRITRMLGGAENCSDATRLLLEVVDFIEDNTQTY